MDPLTPHLKQKCGIIEANVFFIGMHSHCFNSSSQPPNPATTPHNVLYHVVGLRSELWDGQSNNTGDTGEP